MANKAKDKSNTKGKIQRVSVVDQVCDSIKQSILDGVWKPGDKIPSEIDFAETFGVNRLSVRMALQKLITLGIIEVRAGEGTFVCDFTLTPVLKEVASFYGGEDKFHDIRELRKLLEVECIKVGHCNITNSEIVTLKQAKIDYDDYLSKLIADPNSEQLLSDAVEADFRFHLLIIESSHNELYKAIFIMVQQMVRAHISDILHTRSIRNHNLNIGYDKTMDMHGRMLDALISGNYEEAEHTCEIHLNPDMDEVF